MDTSGQLTDGQKEEAAKFLERDFNQCFQQMRHYDGQILDICKFAFTAYTAITGASLALYQYGKATNPDYSLPAALLFLIGLLIGICLFAMLVRNRTYFVFVARYLNAHRDHFLNEEELRKLMWTNPEEELRKLMWTNPKYPPYFNRFSSQSLLLYVLAILNSVLLGLGSFLLFDFLRLFDSFLLMRSLAFTASLILLVLQLVFAISYLKSQDSKA